MVLCVCGALLVLGLVGEVMECFQNFQIRWLIRRDMDEVLEIERQSFDVPWSEDEFLSALRQRNGIGAVAECYFVPEGRWRVLGYMIYELNSDNITLLNFAVCPAVRRQKVGSRLIERLVEKLSNQRRSKIIAAVSEANLQAHLFFQACGFKAVAVENDQYKFVFRRRALVC